jgi:uncharacterized protein (TIGR02328 family)
MRLWHEELLPYLSRQRIQGQHRECCGMRGGGWNTNHETVNYIWDNRPVQLLIYHRRVMELGHMKYDINFAPSWYDPNYRGRSVGYDDSDEWITQQELFDYEGYEGASVPVYSEHGDDYLMECIKNLESKDVDMSDVRNDLL